MARSMSSVIGSPTIITTERTVALEIVSSINTFVPLTNICSFFSHNPRFFLIYTDLEDDRSIWCDDDLSSLSVSDPDELTQRDIGKFVSEPCYVDVLADPEVKFDPKDSTKGEMPLFSEGASTEASENGYLCILNEEQDRFEGLEDIFMDLHQETQLMVGPTLLDDCGFF